MSSNSRKILCYLYLPLSLVYMELVFKFWCFGSVSLRGFLYTTLLSGAFGFALSLACSVRERFARFQVLFWLALAYLLFGAQAVYFRIFKAFLALFSVTKAGGVFGDFFAQALTGIWHSMPFLLTSAVPLVLWLVFGKKLCTGAFPGIRQRAWLAGLFLALQLTAVTCIMSGQAELMSPAYLYSDTLIPSLSQECFGLVTTTRIDLRELMLMESETELPSITFPTDPVPETPEEPEEITLQAPHELVPADGAAEDANLNVLDIDFDRLLDETDDPGVYAMHRYFQSRGATEKNDQTGIFAGKNLIWIIAESFSPYVLDEERTPTLCKLYNEGYTFENFYNPLWGVSTSDGEYVTMTGLIPKYGVWSFSRSAENYMPFSIANMLNAQGYSSRAYHPHSNYYYDRDKSHPNMGYEWIARGSGLEVTDQFPQSDLEMVEATVSDYVNSSPFHVYYLTISGHMFYSFSGNAMAAKHEAETADLPLSEGARAYLACNMELEAALTELLAELEEAGQLNNTVIALSGDHYPYALSSEELAELHGGAYDDPLELYRSAFILWSADLEDPVTVEKPCSSLDIMPTLANLFGLPYDSRLVMGRDMFSDAEGLVIFADHSFISARGRYNAAADTFTPAENAFPADADVNAYARDMLDEIDRMFTYSAEILVRDYYSIVFSENKAE